MEISHYLKNIDTSKIETYIKEKGTTYQKDYNYAVKCFQDRINRDRKKEGLKDLPFMAIKIKLGAVREIDELRSFYKLCCDYKYKKRGNSFSKAFFGALMVK